MQLCGLQVDDDTEFDARDGEYIYTNPTAPMSTKTAT